MQVPPQSERACGVHVRARYALRNLCRERIGRRGRVCPSLIRFAVDDESGISPQQDGLCSSAQYGAMVGSTEGIDCTIDEADIETKAPEYHEWGRRMSICMEDRCTVHAIR
jgi:hypothetical protein